MRVDFVYTASVILNGSGAGTAKIGPLSQREILYPDTASVSANANATNEARCTISVGDVNTKRFVDGCTDGSAGDSTQNVSGKKIKCGEFVWADWTGGDVGVTATLTVSGTKDV